MPLSDCQDPIKQAFRTQATHNATVQACKASDTAFNMAFMLCCACNGLANGSLGVCWRTGNCVNYVGSSSKHEMDVASAPALHSLALVGAGDEAGLPGMRLSKRLEQFILPNHLVRCGQMVFTEGILAHITAEQQATCGGRTSTARAAAVVGTRPAPLGLGVGVGVGVDVGLSGFGAFILFDRSR